MSYKLSFLGAAGTVTGSRYLLQTPTHRILVDCGLFQGYKQLRERNWQSFPVDPASLDAVLLTHAHLDHSGYVPALVRDGFKGPVISTHATFRLCELLLPDSGYLMEADARYAKRKGYSRHKSPRPLYTQEDAKTALKSFKPAPFSEPVEITPDCTAVFRPMGHILGAASIELQCGDLRIAFSGDIGRYGSATMVDPEPVPQADYIVTESTYGNRDHGEADPESVLEDVIGRTVRRGGSVIIPSFAVGRAQSLLYHLSQLRRRGKLPQIPIYLDSPMAVNASSIFCDHLGEHRLTEEQCREACGIAEYVREAEESKALNRNAMPKIIISASGMATGGRILHHLKHNAPSHRNTIILAGYQAGGTRGAALRDGATELKIHGSYIPIRAEVAQLDMLSAHADQGELLHWLEGFGSAPRQVFVTHGEAAASDTFRHLITERFGWPARVPGHAEVVDL
ncbi:Beta-lactamase-like protein [Aurantiacibacter atlanticus]|uniref:Beta-lactamase-like protein n=1 Tax=Aurantiacibacter atlanticus TaxID=1648404 RepID=A0A0H4VFM3_9SPHN|nr:MBL fold metallo-hydrolase [Aurantiacibacter atlanticus]AKQ41621.1 Beta-lactamase-like protein [Aurantiacibacter atlanticus]